MRRSFWGAALLLSAGLLSAEDPLRVPTAGSGKIRAMKDQVEVKWHFGTVTMPAPPPPMKTPEPAVTTHPRAWNRGIFKIRYELAREGGFLRPRKIHITVDNKSYFPENNSDALKAHEEMHRHINLTAIKRIENKLYDFRYASSGIPSDLKMAELAFRQEFRNYVSEVDQLHKEWDKNQIP